MNATLSDRPALVPGHDDPIGTFRQQGTWGLLGLAVITLGLYYGHYCLRQSKALNPYLSAESGKALSSAAFRVLIAGYVSLIPLLILVCVPLSAGIQTSVGVLSDVWTLFWLVMHSIWSLMFRSRLNTYYGAQPGSADWFHGFWAFLFTSLYVNYKINDIAGRRRLLS